MMVHEDSSMSDTRSLLNKFAALRNVAPLPSTSPTLVEDGGKRASKLEHQMDAAHRHDALLNGSLRKMADIDSPESVPLPTQLTSRARRLLLQGRGLLARLSQLGTDLAGIASPGEKDDSDKVEDRHDPLTREFREAAAMADTSLRMVQAFPNSPSSQLQLCEGLEAILSDIARRTDRLQSALSRRKQEQGWVETLVEGFLCMEAGKVFDVQRFVGLSEELLAEAQRGGPLRSLEAPISDVTHFVACHGLMTAQAAARIVRHDPELRDRPLDLILAALVHDVGMLRVPANILAHRGIWDDNKRRAVEIHPGVGAEWAARLLPGAAWLPEAVAGHHERLDGTGYPAGLRGLQVTTLVRALSVCDVYTALCSSRLHRPARDTREALADTLLLAEQGALDGAAAERLLHLSFYPVGTTVELTDGTTGIVVATHMNVRDWNTPAAPVVAVLADAAGQAPATPLHLDLAECREPRVARSLSGDERRALCRRHSLGIN